MAARPKDQGRARRRSGALEGHDVGGNADGECDRDASVVSLVRVPRSVAAAILWIYGHALWLTAGAVWAYQTHEPHRVRRWLDGRPDRQWIRDYLKGFL
jgi:hypothetical protein